MQQTDDGPEAELRLEPEPDVEEHQADRDAQRQEAGGEQLARHLGAHDADAGIGDLADRAADGALDLLDHLGLIAALRHLETHNGGGAVVGVGVTPGDALHLHVPEIQGVHRLAHAIQLDHLTGGFGDLHRGAAPEVDAHVQAGIEAANDGGEAQHDRQHAGRPRILHELEVGLLRQQLDKGPSTHRHHSAIGSFLGLAVFSQ